MTEEIKVAVIGGSGLYQMEGISDIRRVSIDTPFGKPSGDIVIGTLSDKRVAFLPRHGEGHIYAPSAVPYSANIYALKTLGVRFILAVHAAGSLREDYAPGHIVIPDQVFDYTIEKRERSFFREGLVAHISVAEPYSNVLRQQLITAVQAINGTVHPTGTFVIEDGPRFATRAESLIFKSWGCDIIGMTAIPEVFLAREAEIAYASMAHITDYDSWHEEEEAVTTTMVLETLKQNILIVQQAIAYAIHNLDENMILSAHTALDNALATAPNKIPADVLKTLKPIVGRVLNLS